MRQFYLVRLFVHIFKLISVREKHSVNIIFGHVLDVFCRDIVFLSDLFYFADSVGADMSTGTDLPS